MTGHPVLTLRAMRDRRAEDVITGGLADFNRQASGIIQERAHLPGNVVLQAAPTVIAAVA